MQKSGPGPLGPKYHPHVHPVPFNNPQLSQQYTLQPYPANQQSYGQHPPSQHGSMPANSHQPDAHSSAQPHVNTATQDPALAKSYSGQDTRQPGLVDAPLRHSLSGPAPPAHLHVSSESLFTAIPELPPQPGQASNAADTSTPSSELAHEPADMAQPVVQGKGKGRAAGTTGRGGGAARGGAGRGRRKNPAATSPPTEGEGSDANAEVSGTATRGRRNARRSAKKT